MFNSDQSKDSPDDVNHLTTIDEDLFLQYKLSLASASNIASNILLDNVWRNHTESFNREIDQISYSIDGLLQNANVSNARNWQSSLHKFTDPDILFRQSITPCAECSEPSQYIGLENFQRNQCTCDLGLPETAKKQTDIPKTKQLAGKDVYFEGSSSDKSGDEQRLFKPRFGRARQTKAQVAALKTTTNCETDSTKSAIVDCDVDMEKVEEDIKAHNSSVAKITFKTAREQLLGSNPAAKRTLGASRKAQGKFVSPMMGAQDRQESTEPVVTDERLKHLDPKMIELIESEIIDRGTPIGWEDIAGLQMAKSVIQEAVVWPLLRPDIFTGLRRPPKGILLFGPPGTGKTLIGKCIAAQCQATFFSISASSLTSKWIGDGEKMVRALFAVARCRQPAVIFIDEIDSLLTQRSDTEHEATRRIKTEFLVQFDGAATGDEDRLLIVGATNRPQELDEAARRRLVKRLYIPLPDTDARKQIIANLLKSEANELSLPDVSDIAAMTEGYSGADMKSLCSEAAMGPIRSVPLSQIVSIDKEQVRPVNVQDFTNALQRVRPSVSQDDLGQYVKWNKTYGQGF